MLSRVSEHPEFRLDSEYFNPYAIEVEKNLKSKAFAYLSQDSDLIAGPFGSAITVENYVPDSEYRYIRGKDIQNFFVKKNDPIYIGPELYNSLQQFHLKERDILVTVVGVKFGQAAIVSKEECPAVFSCKSTLLRTEKINPYYLVAFLLCKHGNTLIRRSQRGMAQPGINLLDLATIPIPLFSEDFERKIEDVILEAQNKDKESISMFENAEAILLEILETKALEPKREAVNYKNFNESFMVTGRLDAEYYQKKYDDYLSLIYNYSNGFEVLESACVLKDANYSPENNKLYKYIELSNIGTTGEIYDCSLEFGTELPSRARRLVNTNDVIVPSIEGSLQSCAIVLEEYNYALCSTGFYVINSDKINSETLLILFKSEPMQNILKQRCSGTILTAINKNDFLNIPIPIIKSSKQEQIAILVRESFRLKAESAMLLDLAKKAVEIAIEENQNKAFDYLKTTS